MKIALLNNLYFPYNRGGAERVLTEMKEKLTGQGQTVFIVTTKPKKINALKTEIPVSNEKIYYLSSGYYNLAELSPARRALWQFSNLFDLKKYFELKKIFLDEKPDLVITHNLMGLGFLTPRLLRRLKIKQIHFLHDIQLLYPSGLMIYGQEKKIAAGPAKFYQALTRALFASPFKVVSPSHWLLEQHRQRGFFKKSVLEVRPFKKEILTFPESQKTALKNFLFVGQVEEHKGIFLLIEAFRNIDRADLNLSIIGDGQKLESAKKLAATDKRIKFCGRLDFSEVKKIMAASDALIVPSLCYENSPTIISDAQAAGRPVIASNLGGIPEIIGPDDLLFKPTTSELTKILKKISQ